MSASLSAERRRRMLITALGADIAAAMRDEAACPSARMGSCVDSDIRPKAF